jgi:hypothetical protein
MALSNCFSWILSAKLTIAPEKTKRTRIIPIVKGIISLLAMLGFIILEKIQKPLGAK